jgi:translin
MIDKKEFEQMRSELEQYDDRREELIRAGRDIIKLSKQIIYAVHRKDIADAETNIKTIKEKTKSLSSAVKKDPKLDIGSFKAAVQEYVEALCYYHFVKSKKLPTRKELEVDSEYYLMGICDFTGELVRYAVNAGINGDTESVVEIKKLIEEIYNEIMQFDFRNGELRKKSDQVKWDLKKLDDLVFSLKLNRGVQSGDSEN